MITPQKRCQKKYVAKKKSRRRDGVPCLGGVCVAAAGRAESSSNVFLNFPSCVHNIQRAYHLSSRVQSTSSCPLKKKNMCTRARWWWFLTLCLVRTFLCCYGLFNIWSWCRRALWLGGTCLGCCLDGREISILPLILPVRAMPSTRVRHGRCLFLSYILRAHRIRCAHDHGAPSSRVLCHPYVRPMLRHGCGARCCRLNLFVCRWIFQISHGFPWFPMVSQ